MFSSCTSLRMTINRTRSTYFLLLGRTFHVTHTLHDAILRNTRFLGTCVYIPSKSHVSPVTLLPWSELCRHCVATLGGNNWRRQESSGESPSPEPCLLLVAFHCLFRYSPAAVMKLQLEVLLLTEKAADFRYLRISFFKYFLPIYNHRILAGCTRLPYEVKKSHYLKHEIYPNSAYKYFPTLQKTTLLHLKQHSVVAVKIKLSLLTPWKHLRGKRGAAP
jgi:hypothetical protein